MSRNPFVFLGLGAALSAVAGLFMTVLHGPGAEGIGWALDATARVSFAFWILSFTARPLHQWLKAPGTKAILSRRRQLGVAFAGAHLVHAACIYALARALPGSIGVADVLPGAIVYLVILAMLVTSFDTTARMMPGRSWTYLHRTGQWLIALAFLQSALGGLMADDHHFPTHFVLALLTSAAILLRLALWLRARKPKAKAA